MSNNQLIFRGRLSVFGRVWHHGHEPFARAGTDTLMLVSPAGNILWTCDPEVVLQVCHRRHDFVKPVEMMGMLNMYGPTVTATEGEENRVYRKITAPSFNEQTHCAVWIESLEQSEAMLKTWKLNRGYVSHLSDDMARLTLHVISLVCFDRKLQWLDDQSRQGKLPSGHTLSYRESIGAMLENNSTLFVTPPPVLSMNQYPTLSTTS